MSKPRDIHFQLDGDDAARLDEYLAHTAPEYRIDGFLKRLTVRWIAAHTEPLPPPTPRITRPMSQYRAESRERNGGVSAYTAAIDIIPTRKDPA